MGYGLWVKLDLAVPSIMGSDAAHSPYPTASNDQPTRRRGFLCPRSW
jgi:hypothetical protein